MHVKTHRTNMCEHPHTEALAYPSQVQSAYMAVESKALERYISGFEFHFSFASFVTLDIK